MLIKLERITTPVVLEIEGNKQEYTNGMEAIKAIGNNTRLEAINVAAHDNKIIIHLEPWKSETPDNYIGEAGVTY